MIKTKQVLTVVSIALASFIIGSIFSMNFTTLGEREESLPQGFTTTPAYDRGWVSVYEFFPYYTFEHGLNTTNVAVYMVRNNSVFGINQVWTLGSGAEMQWYNLTKNDIKVVFSANRDVIYDEIRVMIWKIPEPPT